MYDATAHANSKTAESTAKTGTTTYTYSFTEDGEYVSNLSSLTKVDAGEYTIYVKGANPNYQNEATTTAKLTIKQRPVTFTGKRETKTYTGETITINTVEVTETAEGIGLVSGHEHNVEFSASGVDKGEYPGTITAKDDIVITTGDTDVTKNYDITVVNGTLTIEATNEQFTIALANDETTYDGLPHANTNTASSTAKTGTTSYTYSFTEDGEYVSDLSSLTQVDAGEYTIYVKGTNPNYKNEATTTAKLTIKQREVTVSVEDKTVKYNGSEQSGNTEYAFENVVSGQTATITYTPSKGILVDTYDNGSYADDFKVEDGEGNDVTKNYTLTTETAGKLTITDENIPDDLVVTKEDAETTENKQYALGEEVTFKITVTNIYAEAKTITLTEIEGVTLAQSVFENVAAGAKVETTATYTITEADILNGSFKNTVTATVDKLEKKAEATVTTEAPNPSLSVEKSTTSEPANGESYALGEEITYEIVVTNDGNLTITNITVKDDLTGDSWTIDALEPGASKTYEASYTVTEADILNGSVVNEATADGDNESDDPTDPGDDEVEDPTEDPKPSLSVEKSTTSEPANGESYVLGEEITYEIVVTNDGNLTITDITVKDDLTGDSWTIDALEPGASKTYEASHKVTETDILNGSVVNEATADGDNESDDPTDPGDDEVEDPTEDPKPSLSVEKKATSTPANGEAYALGETITYKITVTNSGNLTITNVKVTDELTGDEWTIDSLAPGASKEFDAEYTVTEDDILAGSVVNVATADGDNESDDPTDPGKDEEENNTEEKEGHITIEKVTTSTPKNGAEYAVGEKITYKITVTNDGNLTVTDITVTDELTGDEWTIASLAPGASEVFETEYTVTEEDAKAGKVLNVATATGTSKDPDEPDVPVTPGTDDEPTVYYWYSKGDGQTWTKGSTEGAFFVVSRKPNDGEAFSHFLSIEIDGVEVAKTYYDAVSGSVKETIHTDYLETLAVGEHTITTTFDDGKASATFYIAEKLPYTGDDSNLFAYSATMTVSAAALAFVLARKQREEEEAELG